MRPAATSNRLLGHPDDARLLLVNADDLGMYPETVAATAAAFDRGIVRSASLMAVCPAAPAAAAMLRERPGLSCGVHLSLVRDIPTYPWGPAAPRERVPSLLGPDGLLWPIDQRDALLARADIREVELEFRAQIDLALAAGLAPTHLDWHCLLDGGRPDILDLTLALAREHRLAVRIDGPANAARLRAAGLPVADFGLMDSFAIATADKPARYAAMLRELPAGLNAWAVHPGLDTPHVRATDPAGWPVRSADGAFLISEEARRIVEAEGIVLIGYGALREAWAAEARHT